MNVTSSSLTQALKLPLGDGDVLLWWLGQAGFLLRSGEGSLLIDPYLTPTGDRLFPPPFLATEAVVVDAVLVTHEHGDHLDVDVVKAFVERDAAASWVVPAPITGRLTDLGVHPERIVPAQPGDRLQLGPIKVDPVAAQHGVTMADAYDTGEVISGGLVRFLGYVVELAGTRIYHSGDCLAYPGLAEELARLSVDIVLLPINGRDPAREARGIVGNMSSDEAVALAGRSGAKILVPMHWDLFSKNPGKPSKAVALVERDYPGLTVLVPSRDRPTALHQVGRRWMA